MDLNWWHARAADIAERYRSIYRAMPAVELDRFVRNLGQRIAAFPAAAQVAVKVRVNAIPLAPVEDIQRDSDEFAASVRSPQTQRLLQEALDGGFHHREAERGSDASWVRSRNTRVPTSVRHCADQCPPPARRTSSMSDGGGTPISPRRT